MKDIRLVIHIISDFIRRKKLVAVVLIIASVLFGVSYMTVLGGFISFFSDVGSEELADCMHTVTFMNEQSLSDAETYTSNKFFKSRTYSEFNGSAVAEDGKRYYITTFSGTDNSLLAYVVRDGRLYFTADEMNGSNPAVFVSSDICKQVGTSVILPFWKNEFTVAGVIDDPFGSLIVVPEIWFEKAEIQVYKMNFTTKRKLTVFEERKLEYDLCGDGQARMTGGITYEETAESNTADLIGCLILAAVVLILGFYLFNYVSQKNKYTYGLLGILGSSKANTMFLLMLERVLSVFIITVISSVIHFLIRGELHEFLMISECRMGFAEYALASAVMIIAAVLASVPFALYYIKNSYTTVVKHYE